GASSRPSVLTRFILTFSYALTDTANTPLNDPATAVLLTTLALIAVALLAGVFGFRLGSRAARATRSRRTHAASERSRLTNRLLDLETSTVDDIMIPRNEIASIDLEDDWNTILDVLRSTPHTRLPV